MSKNELSVECLNFLIFIYLDRPFVNLEWYHTSSDELGIVIFRNENISDHQ